ncbi:MAG: indole-3-glycerol-phosphate synthase [Archaeoglobaceae archaeon]
MDFGFIDAIKERKKAVIAEIKAFSPTHGDLLKKRDPLEIARLYEEAGSAAISYITAKSFNGNLDTLKRICREVSVPVLRKDFVKSKEDVELTCNADADALLLIARILGEKTPEFTDFCFEHGIEPVVEIFCEEEIQFAKNSRIVLINNRDIFNPERVDLQRTFILAPKIDKLKISGSGIKKIEDLKILKVVDAVLIGTAFMLAKDTKEFVSLFVEARI